MDRKRFIENLTNARKDRGLTQKQVAEALGVSDRTYSKWETGETEPGIELLCRLAEFYGLSPADLFKEETPKEGSPIRAELEALTPVQAKLRASEIMDDAFDGIADGALRLNKNWNEEAAALLAEPLPVTPPPEGFQSGYCCHGRLDEAFFLRAWDANTDLRLLLMPAANGFRWLKEEKAALAELFRTLSSVEMLDYLFRQSESQWYTPEHLSRETGLPLEKVRELLGRFGEWKLTGCLPTRTAEGEVETWSHPDTRLLRAIVTLAHLILERREGGD